ncbi:Golgi CORVET complex core vacuolar protein 8-domain-containing protein [Amylostereum chailletii]|nr:Golgi CORVET complex core vacuolar protein 8-domain-containing protein [Amylostereum chailletii]
MDSPLPHGLPSGLPHPFLHPTISRLRSFTPQASRVPSSNSVGTFVSNGVVGSPAPSHFSALSPMSSTTNLHASFEKHDLPANGHTPSERQVFRWTTLRSIGQAVYSKPSQKAAAILGTSGAGTPLVMAANGLICIGTDGGRAFVFDFKQSLKCICGDPAQTKTVGPVTALAVSHDHTYLAMGHAHGHVQIYDMTKPHTPARFVPPTTFAAVASGRKEGHLEGSRIVNVGFVAGRHTAVVTADQHGLAFYHSLGKVLFVDASDVLRILGKYPDEESAIPPAPSMATPRFRRRRVRKTNTILAMAPLPLGTSPHSTDAYNIIAILTGVKLVIVGLKPAPKTWYRRHRNADEEQLGKSKFRGSLAWFPSVVSGTSTQAEISAKKGSRPLPEDATVPMLVYSWGPTLNLLRVSETKVTEEVVNERTGKSANVEVGKIVFEEVAKWSAQDDVLSVQWLNAKQIVAATASSLEVYDVQSQKLVEHVHFNISTLISPTLGLTANGSMSYSDSVGDIAHSMRTYKGKIFLLGRQEIQVGTLLTWADRILSFVQEGDFLSAIEMTRTYYLGKAPGNKNGLPDDPQQLREVVGEKMRELMTASIRYAFSEDRMTDATHYTPDGRGVDRTSLFEGLVATCARACIALDDFDLLFEDLFQSYDDAGIARIYLEQLETFILDNDIRYVPPRITQRLVAMHADDRRPDRAERVIWHIDPECLDINQAIHLCQSYQLYDALIYVYTRAMKDYVSPIVDLLALVRKVMQLRRGMASPSHPALPPEHVMEPIFINAYKIFPYLANVLSGLSYPSEEQLDDEEANQAKKDVYAFLFFGRSSVWPMGDGGKLVLTSEEEGGMEPTYPYCRLLLRFDAEAFLHSLDLAFEDAYLNDETQGVSRLVIVKIVLEILNSPGLSDADRTFVNIFIARNVPKYPQFIQIAPSALHDILVGLASDPDMDTREDRQLAAEYLLSAYTPHDGARLLALFEEARFYRILRSWHRQEQQWASLLVAYLHDPDLPRDEVFSSAEQIMASASRANHGSVPEDLLATISDSIPDFLNASITDTALFVDQHVPELHQRALNAIRSDVNHKRFAYLRHLLGPAHTEDDDDQPSTPPRAPSNHIPEPLRLLYVSLQCQIDPAGLITALRHLPENFVEWDDVLSTCEEHEVYEAVVWALNWRGNAEEALSKVELFDERLVIKIGQQMAALNGPNASEGSLQHPVEALRSVGRMGVSICLEHSRSKTSSVPIEEMWFQLLHSQIESVQSVQACCSIPAVAPGSSVDEADDVAIVERETLSVLRSLVQETFSALVSVSSARGLSFPRLFKRLVDATSRSARGTPYTEFRTILTGMMESYRFEGDMLVITKHLLDRDVFETIAELAKERVKGWAPARGVCGECRRTVLPEKQREENADHDPKIVVSRTGVLYHSRCAPADISSRIVH